MVTVNVFWWNSSRYVISKIYFTNYVSPKVGVRKVGDKNPKFFFTQLRTAVRSLQKLVSLIGTDKC